MSDDSLLARILSTFAGLDRSRLSNGYPPDFRALVVEYVRARREEGWTWPALDEQLPVSVTSARTWLEQALSQQGASPRGGSLVAVQVVDDPVVVPTPGLVLTSPTGYRLTGMTLDQAALLLGHLG